MTINSLILNATDWAALAAVSGGRLTIQNNSVISCPGGTGLYADGAGSTITGQNISIPSALYGVQLKNASTAALHGLTVTASPYAVLTSGVGTTVTIDQNSLLSYPNPSTGVGLALQDGAAGIVRDSTINGFINGIDIQSTTPTIYYGTVDVDNCTFNGNGSAIAASYGSNIRFANSTVMNAVTDGIYFENSTAVVENTQVIGSLNTGVSFIGCPDGTLQDSLVKDSVHQGVSVVAELPSTPPSLNIKVLNNTFVNNQIANLLVDDRSTAKVQGNIFARTPDTDIRFYGPLGITLDAALVIDSQTGVEISGGSTTTVVLSDISRNDRNGILAYGSSLLAAEHSIFWDNGLTAVDGTADSYSVFINTTAQASARNCSFGPSTPVRARALYNLSTAACDVSSNYWAASDGPLAASWILPQGQPNGTGAHLDSGYQVSGAVTYLPFLNQPPVNSSVNDAVGLASGGGLGWDSSLGLALGLTANPGSPVLSGEILGVLKVNDTGSLNLVSPPDYLLPGGLYVVWISAPLRSNSASGFLAFSLPSQNSPVALQRRGYNGSWTQVASTWNGTSHQLVYAPSDPHLLNGTFAITDTPGIMYANWGGGCSGHAPCYDSVQSGVNAMLASTIMNITREDFPEVVTYDNPGVLTLSGGWDDSYTTQDLFSTIQSLAIIQGKVIADRIEVY